MTLKEAEKGLPSGGFTTPINRRNRTCSIVRSLQTKPRDAPAGPGGPDGFGPFRHAETPRPDTDALLAEIGMPSHSIRTFVPSQAGIGSDG